MKSSTKTCLICIALLIPFLGNTQKFGITGGLNLTKMLFEEDGQNYTSMLNQKPGFHAGLIMETPFNDFLSLQTSLLVESKGFLMKEEDSGVTLKVSLNLLYLDLPMQLKARYRFTDKFAMFGAFGGYVGLGLTGKTKLEVEYMGDKETETESVEWGNDPDEDMLKRLDFGLSFGGGVDFNSFTLAVYYDLGLTNTPAGDEDDIKVKNRSLRISLAYWFGGNSKKAVTE